ncbi:origin recognition complex subunit 2-like [Patiria miniata]|uniref:Origin recognition complex subunit 2 n=1 Tax=Patiria miniata TaxID=46514 RepID=A0A914BLQ4_PATMI|nr:origin recognition complex subunit 2-like [Patiria miniata]
MLSAFVCLCSACRRATSKTLIHYWSELREMRKMAASRGKHVALQFVGNDEVIKHIVAVDEVSSAKKPRRSKVQMLASTTPSQRPVRSSRKSVNYKERLLKAQDRTESSDEDDENDEEGEGDEQEHNKTPDVLLDEAGIKGTDVYQFKKYKRSGQMAQLARSSATPVSSKKPTQQRAEPRVTRRSRRTIPDSDDDSDSSKTSSSDEDSNDDNSSTHSKDSTSTPHRSGRGVRGCATRDVRGGATPAKGSAVKGPITRRRTRGDVELPNMAEEYFSAHSGQSVTSDHTLARLAIPKMDQDDVSKALGDAPNSHSREISEMYQEYRGLFNKWMFQLSNGFNLMLYGLGSKRRLLDMFRAEMLSNWSHVVVNGFFPGLTVKSILNSITDDVFEHEAGFRSLAEQTEYIHDTLEEREEPLFLIIHNIDGVMLRGHKAQATLSALSQLASVHIIATIDHINAPLIWDQSKSSSFYWMFYDVTTYEPYTEETSYENSLLVQQSGVLALSSLTHVLRSLTPNARGIFNLLVGYQLSHQDDATYQGLSFNDLYQKCREAFLVNSELTLRAQLTEFRDHKLIRSKKGLDGVEFLMIAVDSQTLVEFQQQEEV